jgi:hypothetical protein
VDVAVGVGALLLYASGIGLLMRGPRAWRALLLAIAAAVLTTALFLRDEPFFSMVARGFMSMGYAGTFLRFVDLAKEPRPLPAGRRLLHAVAMVEMRRTPWRGPRLDLPSVARLVGYGGLSAAAFAVIAAAGGGGAASRCAVYAAALVACYTTFDTFCAFERLLWSGLGFELPRLHDAPIKSRTVAEFWGERWNRIVGGWLRAHVFSPFARRRRPLLGVALAFVASALLHAYLAWVTLDALAGLTWAAFFLVQIPIVLVERRLRVAAWRPLLGRAWTATALLSTSPLFVWPVIRAIDAVRAGEG